jgi:hypothetical protein
MSSALLLIEFVSFAIFFIISIYKYHLFIRQLYLLIILMINFDI